MQPSEKGIILVCLGEVQRSLDLTLFLCLPLLDMKGTLYVVPHADTTSGFSTSTNAHRLEQHSLDSVEMQNKNKKDTTA